jgi:hypothetical protein
MKCCSGGRRPGEADLCALFTEMITGAVVRLTVRRLLFHKALFMLFSADLKAASVISLVL